MSSRPSSFKRGGGGYLNNVDATIVGYQFVTGETVKVKKGNRAGEDFTPLSFVPEFKVDGADDTCTQRLLIGDAEMFGEVSEDGLTLSTPEAQVINAVSEAGKFIESLCATGFDDTQLSDDPDSINFEAIIGTRVRLVQVINAEKTKRQGQQVDAKGNKWDRKDLMVEAVLGQAGAKVVGKATAAKPTVVKAAGGKPNGKAVDITELTDETLVGILNASDGKILKSKVPVKVNLTLGAKHPHRNDVRNMAIDEAYLADAMERGVISYDSKTQVISAA